MEHTQSLARLRGRGAQAGRQERSRRCQLFLDHARKIICSGNEEHYDYLIKREAFIAQRRTAVEIAVGFRTEAEGTGKGLYSRTLNHLYGIHAMEIQNPDHVVGQAQSPP